MRSYFKTLLYHTCCVLIVLGGLISNCAVQADERPKLRLHPESIIADHVRGYTTPCHLLQLTYAERFPASRTLDPKKNPFLTAAQKSGKLTSEQYKSARFKPNHKFEPDDKFINFRRFDYFDFESDAEDEFVGDRSKDEFVGWVRIDSKLVKETYSLKKHGPKENLLQANQLTDVSGDAVRWPIFEEVTKTYDAGYEGRFEHTLRWVYYEMCTVRFFVDGRIEDGDLGLRGELYPTFPFENSDDLLYPPDAAPTVLGYDWDQRTTEDWDVKSFAVQVFIVTGSAIPVLGTAITLAECLETRDSLCWASFGLDLTSDVIVVAKVLQAAGMLAKLNNAVGTAGDACKINKFLEKPSVAKAGLYAIGAGNVTLGGFYAKREDYVNGLARIAAGGSDIFSAVLLSKGSIKGGVVDVVDNCVRPPDLTVLAKPAKKEEMIRVMFGKATTRNKYVPELSEVAEDFQYVRHPDVKIYTPDDVGVQLPHDADDLIYVVTKADNRWGIKFHIAREKYENLSSIPETLAGSNPSNTLGHMTLVSDSDEILYAGRITFNTALDDSFRPLDGEFVMKIDNVAPRISFDSQRNPAGLYYASRALDHMIDDDPAIVIKTFDFKGIRFQEATNKGHKKLDREFLDAVDGFIKEIIDPTCRR